MPKKTTVFFFLMFIFLTSFTSKAIAFIDAVRIATHSTLTSYQTSAGTFQVNRLQSEIVTAPNNAQMILDPNERVITIVDHNKTPHIVTNFQVYAYTPPEHSFIRRYGLNDNNGLFLRNALYIPLYSLNDGINFEGFLKTDNPFQKSKKWSLVIKRIPDALLQRACRLQEAAKLNDNKYIYLKFSDNTVLAFDPETETFHRLF